MSKQGLNFGRFLIEAVVIVVSILLAFGIDAWWDERREREEEAAILAGLEREFESVHRTLERRIALHGDILSALTAVLIASEAGDWVVEDRDVDTAIGRILSPPTTDLGNGVRDALVQGGRLELVSDSHLRERLAAWPAFYEEVLDDEVFARGIVLDKIVPYLAARGTPMAAPLKAGALPPDREWPIPARRIADDPEAMRALLKDPQFRSLMEVRYAYWVHTGMEYERALEEAMEILELLQTLR